MSWMLLAALEAFAAPADAEPESPPFGISLRGVAETWDDASIGAVYRTGGFSSGAALLFPLPWDPVMVTVEATYKRAGSGTSGTSHFEMLPITILGEYALYRDGRGEVYAGLGPALMVFTEHHPDNGAGVLRGTRLGIETRVGGRFDTGLVNPTLPPAPQGLDRIELEVYAARRFQRPGMPGFQLGAWRAGLGVVFRL